MRDDDPLASPLEVPTEATFLGMRVVEDATLRKGEMRVINTDAVVTASPQDVAAINRFANNIARYVATAVHEQPWLPHRWMVEAVTVVLSDEGAATEMLTLMPTQALRDELAERGDL